MSHTITDTGTPSAAVIAAMRDGITRKPGAYRRPTLPDACAHDGMVHVFIGSSWKALTYAEATRLHTEIGAALAALEAVIGSPAKPYTTGTQP